MMVRSTQGPTVRVPGCVGGAIRGGWVEPLAPPDSWVRVPDFNAINNTESLAVEVKWPTSGVVCAVASCARGLASAISQSSLGIAIRTQHGGNNLIWGGANNFVLFQNQQPFGTGPAPMYRRVRSGESWWVTAKNYLAVEYTPEVVFHFREECHDLPEVDDQWVLPTVAPNSWVRPEFGAINNAESDPKRIEWQTEGIVTAMACSARGLASAVSQSSLALAVKIERESRNLISAGASNNFALFQNLQPFGTGPAPMYRWVRPGDVWMVTAKNYLAVEYTPEVAFQFRECEG